MAKQAWVVVKFVHSQPVWGEPWIYVTSLTQKCCYFNSLFSALVAIHVYRFFTYTCTDIMDSSGVQFIYENAPRRFDAGILVMGHQIHRLMIIPPLATNYGVTGVCSSECTSRVSTLQTRLIIWTPLANYNTGSKMKFPAYSNFQNMAFPDIYPARMRRGKVIGLSVCLSSSPRKSPDLDI